MNNKELQTVSEEKDLGVIIQDNLKVDKQVAASVAKANKMLGMIRRSFKSRDEKMTLQLYKLVVRPHVEFAISSWSIHGALISRKTLKQLKRSKQSLLSLPYI